MNAIQTFFLSFDFGQVPRQSKISLWLLRELKGQVRDLKLISQDKTDVCLPEISNQYCWNIDL